MPFYQSHIFSKSNTHIILIFTANIYSIYVH